MDPGGGGASKQQQQQQSDSPGSRGGARSKKLQEPPKFYNKTYLRRYTHGTPAAGAEVRSGSPSVFTPPASTILQGIANRKKAREASVAVDKASPTRHQFPSLQAYRDRKASGAHSRSTTQKVSKDSSDPATTITISPTVLKLSADGTTKQEPLAVQAPVAATTSSSAARPKSAKQIRPGSSVNPYNRVPASSDSVRLKLAVGGSGTADQHDGSRYSFVQAMSSGKPSFFKSDAIPEVYSSHHKSDDGPFHATVDWARQDTFKRIKHRVEEAIKRHKVFLIRGELPKLKEALEERGWVQKYESSRTRSLPYTSAAPSLDAKSLGDVRLPDGSPNERAVVFALLRNAQPDFIWDCRNDFVEWDRGIAGSVLLNRFHKPSLYTSKLGMAHVLQEAHWIHEANVADVLFPRSYNPSREMSAMIQDFRRSAAIAVLRVFVKRMDVEAYRATRSSATPAESPASPDPEPEKPEESGASQQQQQREQQSGTFSLDWIETALKCCDSYAVELENDDVDAEAEDDLGDEQWRAFFEDYDRFLHKADGMASLPRSDPERLEACHVAAATVLEKLKKADPQFGLSGEKNIWIVKPSNLCCGSGIFMTHDLRTILRKVDGKPRDYYIVQKYIERPLLVQGTKFDIRQWFLVTSAYPMTIWSFREALLRLSSKPYCCATYHEAIHICNTAVQEKYDWDRRRRRHRGGHQGGSTSSAGTAATDDPDVSVRDLGWDCEKLNGYFKSQGYPGEPYYEKIYPKMTQAIVLTMLAAQDFMDRRRCSFELYGADFMVMEDMSVWLIEINTNPRMHPPSSRITQRLYGSVLDSLVKVVMDLPVNPHADTGGFELVYKQDVPESQPYLGPCLFAFGKAMTLHEADASAAAAEAAKKDQQQAHQKSRSSRDDPDRLSHWSKQPYRAWTAPPLTERLREPKVLDFMSCLGGGGNSCDKNNSGNSDGAKETPTQ